MYLKELHMKLKFIILCTNNLRHSITCIMMNSYPPLECERMRDKTIMKIMEMNIVYSLGNDIQQSGSHYSKHGLQTPGLYCEIITC